MQLIYKAWILRFTQDDSAGLMPRVAGHCASVPVQLETTPPPCKYSEETDCVGRAPRPPSEALRELSSRPERNEPQSGSLCGVESLPWANSEWNEGESNGDLVFPTPSKCASRGRQSRHAPT